MTMTSMPSTQTYQLLGPLDEGGMGQVAEGRIELPLRQSRPCAIKSIRESKMDLRYVMLFVREATIGWDVTGHPNIVNTRNFGTWEDGTLFIVVDREGPALDLVSEELHGRYPRIRRIARGILRALEYLQQKRVVHCDISPANILLSSDGNAKLNDFGLARRVDDGAPRRYESISVGMVGVPAYASPETMRGATPSYESDFYSFGAVLYELATGVPPVQSTSDDEILASLADAPADLAELICGLLCKEPSARLSSAKALGILEESGEPEASWEEIAAIATSWQEQREADNEELHRAETEPKLLDLAEQYLRVWDDRERQRRRRQPVLAVEDATQTAPKVRDPATETQEKVKSPTVGLWKAGLAAAAIILLLFGLQRVVQAPDGPRPHESDVESTALSSDQATQISRPLGPVADNPAGPAHEARQTWQAEPHRSQQEQEQDREPAEIAKLEPSAKAEPVESSPSATVRTQRRRSKRPGRSASAKPPAAPGSHRTDNGRSSPARPSIPATWATPGDWQ